VSSLFLLWESATDDRRHGQALSGRVSLTKSQSAWCSLRTTGLLPDVGARRVAGDQARVQIRIIAASDCGVGRILVHPGHPYQRTGACRARIANLAFVAFWSAFAPSPAGSRFWNHRQSVYHVWAMPLCGHAHQLGAILQRCRVDLRSIIAACFSIPRNARRSTGSQTLYIPYVAIASSSSCWPPSSSCKVPTSKRGRLSPGRFHAGGFAFHLAAPHFVMRSRPSSSTSPLKPAFQLLH